MLTKYKTYKALNESLGFSLGLKSPSSIGLTGSKLAEMGLNPKQATGDEDGDEDDFLDQEDDNQDPNLDSLNGDDSLDGSEDLDGLDGDDDGDDSLDQIDDFGGDEDLSSLLGGQDDLGDQVDDKNPSDPTFSGNDLSDLHAALSAQDVGSDGMPAGMFGDDQTDLSGVGDGGSGLDDGGDEFGSLFQGQQGPGAPDFGDEDETDDKFDDDSEDDDDEDNDNEEDFDDEENDDDDEKTDNAKAFALKKSKKFMNKGQDCTYSKQLDCQKDESNQFFESLVGMGRGEVRKKFSSGIMKNEEQLFKPTKNRKVEKEPMPGEVGYAPTGKLGQSDNSFPTVADYLEARRNQKTLKESLTTNRFDSRNLSTQDMRGMGPEQPLDKLDNDNTYHDPRKKERFPVSKKMGPSVSYHTDDMEPATPEESQPGSYGRRAVNPNNTGSLQKVLGIASKLSPMEKKILVRKLLGQ